MLAHSHARLSYSRHVRSDINIRPSVFNLLFKKDVFHILATFRSDINIRLLCFQPSVQKDGPLTDGSTSTAWLSTTTNSTLQLELPSLFPIDRLHHTSD
jgi:hypothetical protein